MDEIILSLRGLKPQPKHYAPINIDFTFPKLTPFRGILGRIQRTAFSPAEPEFEADVCSIGDFHGFPFFVVKFIVVNVFFKRFLTVSEI